MRIIPGAQAPGLLFRSADRHFFPERTLALEVDMVPISVEEAQDRLPELMDEAAGGEDVVIARADGSAFRLVPIEMLPRPRFGSARGLFTLAHDFDAPLEDFRDYER